MQICDKKTGVEGDFTITGHAVLNNSINFKIDYRSQTCLRLGISCIVQVFFIKFRTIIYRK